MQKITTFLSLLLLYSCTEKTTPKSTNDSNTYYVQYVYDSSIVYKFDSSTIYKRDTISAANPTDAHKQVYTEIVRRNYLKLKNGHVDIIAYKVFDQYNQNVLDMLSKCDKTKIKNDYISSFSGLYNGSHWTSLFDTFITVDIDIAK